ncbi:ABC transporter ATP-binding protein [Roseibium limicola]|uniref:ABC transporter ATP-binding protein n=1 Tax=Roseibium limicola TaxID=2816037 RepID=UPI001AD8CE83|nr:ABC transporter ATP-binding protein [Roseibium limicola]
MVSLRLEKLSAAYGQTTILENVSTDTLMGGQLVALLGPNAAGKSTLFRRILGHLKGAGTVHLEGHSKDRPICHMPQDTGVSAALSVYEAVLLSRMQGRSLRVADEDLAQVENTLQYIGISALAQRNIADLSGGQRQLVSAAQAIVQEPEILLLDEPTSALDLHRQIDLLRILRNLADEHKILIILAMHDLGHALRFTDQAIVLNKGTVAAAGLTNEILKPQLLRDVYQVEARIEPCQRGRLQIIIDDVA